MQLRKRKATAAGTGSADADGVADTDAASPAVPTPAPAKQAKRSAQRKPPQDIGIPSLLLGGGMGVEEATRAVDSMPLAAAGFTRESLAEACRFLAKADPRLAPFIEQHGPPERLVRKTQGNFATLAKAIAFQQLATNAAAAIYGRVLAACGCEDAAALTPAAVLAAPLPALRAAGLSERKASYMADLAAHFHSGRLSDEMIAGCDEAQLEAALTAVKGIGLWTVHMCAPRAPARRPVAVWERAAHRRPARALPQACHVPPRLARRAARWRSGRAEGHADAVRIQGTLRLCTLVRVRPRRFAVIAVAADQRAPVPCRTQDLPTPQAMERVAEKWRPYRSLGAYWMWKVETPRSAAQGKKGKKA